jgi:hypothetical protein
MAVQNSTRKWVFIGVGVVAAAALVMFFQNYPPQPTDSAATIGAAQRYHSTQITGADVKVSQDELTTWIQSDTFDRIVKDPQARKLFTDAAVISMFNDAARRLDADGVRGKEILNADGSRQLGKQQLDADMMRKQLDADGVRGKEILNSDMMRQQLDADGVRGKEILNSDLMRQQLDADGVQQLGGGRQLDGMRKQLDADGMRKLVDLSSKLDADGMRKLVDLSSKLDADGMRKLVDMSAKLDADGMRKLVDLSSKLNADGMRKLVDMSAKLDADGMRKQIEALDNAALRSAIEDKAFLQAISKGNLMDGLVNQARIADTAGSPQ